jgi:hypothetical protein
VEQVEQISIEGYHPSYVDDPDQGPRETRFMSIDSIEFPDLVNVTDWGLSIGWAHNISSIKFPKLEYASSLDFDLSGGPVVKLSFPNLRATGVFGISIIGNIDAYILPPPSN